MTVVLVADGSVRYFAHGVCLCTFGAGLAVSDALFCVAVLPRAYIGAGVFSSRQYDFRIVYAAYGDTIVNMFIVSSTWLTVAMAVSRYVAICHPLHARQIIGRTFATLTLAGVFAISVLANVPRFFRQNIYDIACREGGHLYFVDVGWLAVHPTFERVYHWTYFLVCTMTPFVFLIYCNVNLIVELRRSLRMRAETTRSRTGRCAGSGSDSSAANRITLTLIVIVAMYFALVIPAEVMNFVREVAVSNPLYVDTYNLAVAVANAFQAVNFALNFILYCAVNTHFRQTFVRVVYRAFCCGRSPVVTGGHRVVGYTTMSQAASYRIGGPERTRMTVFVRSPSPSPAHTQRRHTHASRPPDNVIDTRV